MSKIKLDYETKYLNIKLIIILKTIIISIKMIDLIETALCVFIASDGTFYDFDNNLDLLYLLKCFLMLLITFK